MKILLHITYDYFFLCSLRGSQMCTVASSRQPTAPQTPVTLSRRGSTTTFSTTLGLAKMLNERGIKAVTPSAVATPCGDRSFTPTATPCNSPDGTPPSPPPSPPPYNPLKFPGMDFHKLHILVNGKLWLFWSSMLKLKHFLHSDCYVWLAGFLTSGADLLRRKLTGDDERQAMKTHGKNKRSKMALSRSERKVKLHIQSLVYSFLLHIRICCIFPNTTTSFFFIKR